MSEWAQQYVNAWNSHDPERVAALYADDGTYEAVGSSLEWAICGKDAIKAMAVAFDRFSNDSKLTLVSELISADRFAIEMEESSTNTGEVAPGVPATNKRYIVRVATLGRLDAAGKIKEEREYVNTLHLYTQIGVLTRPGE